MLIRFFRNANGVADAEVPPPNEALGWYLEQDIQSDAGSAQELLDLIDEVASGRREGWSATGNAHTLTLSRDGAVIENEFTEPPVICRLSLDEMADALRRWMEFISAPVPGPKGGAK
jgi:hypothetical protein